MIYKGSRYTDTEMYNRDDVIVFKRRELLKLNTEDSVKHTVIQSDTLSTIAHSYYMDAQLWWILLEVNPQYKTAFDIKVGDILVIPPLEEVMKYV